ncbi:MAG: hypothetical protein ACLUD2_06365 [Clostridium sp.]
MWKSPNATIRSAMDGTGVPRADPDQRHRALCQNLGRSPSPWPAMHTATSTVATEMKIDRPGKMRAGISPLKTGPSARELIHNFTTPGVAQGIHNLDNFHPAALPAAACPTPWM